LTRVDLHTHTNASDGLLSPQALVRAIQAARLAVFSVTDHDTVDALAEVREHAARLGLLPVPGIELSAMWRGAELHILGYFIDPTDRHLLGFLRRRREARRVRLGIMLDRLRLLGVTVAPETVLAKAQDGNVTRPHLARVLAEEGYVASPEEAFDRYLAEGKPAYVPRPDVQCEEAIRVIHEAGGFASWAHPGINGRDEAIPVLVEAGLDAIEVYHPKHSPGVTAHYRRMAEREGLLVTGGSDFHGTSLRGHGIAPGNPILPEPDFLRLKAAAEGRRPLTRP
jgi:predicted metal-dependent phosphoesterase TrpH